MYRIPIWRGVNLREVQLEWAANEFEGELKGHTNDVCGVALTPDGRKAISGE